MTTRKFGGTLDRHYAQGQKGMQKRQAEIDERKRIIKEKNLAVGDEVLANGLLCVIDLIEPHGSLRLFHRSFNTRLDSRATRAFDPSVVSLHKKKGS